MVQFVRVSDNVGGGQLNLAEIEVYSGGVNVARDGTASQSSMGWGGVAARGIDGGTAGNWGGHMMHTNNGGEKWWEVDLKKAYPIEKVIIYNRQDGCCKNRINGAVVILKDAGGNEVAKWGPISSNASQARAFWTLNHLTKSPKG